ncbi:LOW QUALITY PROTEIN: FK506-binding protein 5-like [Macrobrachium nipponense]|uniref:LOW QUALITY PROTEIN: FK506-binding protein 5-like n=1 Tax=Macrobrachium nipponense TaxID=159736 RepID=UPI0030C7B769
MENWLPWRAITLIDETSFHFPHGRRRQSSPGPGGEQLEGNLIYIGQEQWRFKIALDTNKQSSDSRSSCMMALRNLCLLTSLPTEDSGYSSSHVYSSLRKDWMRDGGGPKSSADELDKINEDISRKKYKGSPEGVWCLMELLRHQEELIAQLEKENEFLKREIISVSDGAKKVAQENQDLSRRLAQALSQALARDENTDSSLSTSNSQAEKVPESLDKLQREKVALMAEVERLQSALDAMTEREQSALDKLRAALSIAEETQAFTTQVRASSESAIEELSGLLRSTKEEGEELKHLLQEAEKRTSQEEEQQEKWRSEQEKKVKLLEEEITNQGTQITQLEGEVREKGRQIVVLKDDLQAAQAAKARIETQLEEQRQHAKDAHARLDHIIMTRGAEAATATTRARELEDRLSSARQDINRLLNTITSIAQGPGKIRDLQSTDDVKSERLAAEHQMSTLLSSLQDRHEEEIKALHDASTEHRKSVDALRQEIAEMRQEIVDDNERNRECLHRIGQSMGVPTPEGGSQGVEGPIHVSKPVLIDDDEKNGAVQASLPAKDEIGVKKEGGDTPEKNQDNANMSSGSKEMDLITDSEGGKKSPKNHTEENLPPKEKQKSSEESSKDIQIKPDSDDTKETKDKPNIPKEPKKPNSDEVSDKKEEPKKPDMDEVPDKEEPKKPDLDNVVADKKEEPKIPDLDNVVSDKKEEPKKPDLVNVVSDKKEEPKKPDLDNVVSDKKEEPKKPDLDEVVSDKIEEPKKPDTDEVSDKKESDGIKVSLPADGKKSPSEVKKENGNTNSVVPSPSECDACHGWPLIVQVVGQALEEIQVDVDKQATRLGRMMSTHNSQCNNCLKYQLFLGVAMYRLNDLYNYSDTLGQRIDSLLYRIMTS